MFGNKRGRWTALAAAALLLVAGHALATATGGNQLDPGVDAGSLVVELKDAAVDEIQALAGDEERGSDRGNDPVHDDRDGADNRDGGHGRDLSEHVQTVRAAGDDTAAAAQATVGEMESLVQEYVVNPVQSTAAELQQEIIRLNTEPEGPEESPEPTYAPAASTAQFSVPTPLLIAAAGAAAGGLALFWLAGSSSTATAASAELRRLLPGASPLFTRFERDTVLGHPKRETLYALVMQTPGITLQDLCDGANLSRTAVTHHLRLLEHHHLIVSRRVGRSRHYYENGGRYGREQKEAYAVLRNDRTREVAEFIQAHPGSIQKSICEALGIQPSVAHWHVKRLQEAQVVDAVRRGRTVSYFAHAIPT